MDETFSDPAGTSDPASKAAVSRREDAGTAPELESGAEEHLHPARTRPSSPKDASLRAASGRRRRGDGTPELFPGAFDRPETAGEHAPAVEETPATETEAENLRGALEACLESEQFLTWFQRSRLIAHAGREAIVAVPNGFARNWIEKYYMESLQRCVEAVLGQGRIAVLREEPERVAVPEQGRAEAPSAPVNRAPRADLTSELGPLSDQEARAGGVGARRQAPSSAPQNMAAWNLLDVGSDFVLNPRCTFAKFVVGPCNRFGHAATIGASEQPGRAYNPLFLHGRVGVGKTHLLQAFCHTLLERNPGTRILYLSCETFVNHFVTALSEGDMMAFREKYRNVDVLVVDDVQLLANKERTQEEFFHTFNSLFNAGKQIVLSSDSPPKDIPTLQDRLVSRFKWGMVSEIEPPCYETRMAIVKRKAAERGALLPDQVVRFIAENIEENVRELEGAVTRLSGYTALSAEPITLEMAQQCLAGLIEVRRGAPTVDDIIRLVTEHYQVKLSDLQSKRRTKTIAFPRQVAMYLARKLTRHSLEEIGGFFGGRDHTTVMYAVDKMQTQIEEDGNFDEEIQRFMEQLLGRG
ncbi:MAG: chromosomal replication initiator protein DnaA [Planctomycetota bacterium]|nr:chromosomal replication initiator protein DnaA [Planctomycetota bacterium]MEC8511613.1 chromosomal replication initiator protein DnaA [Planctomycetota bacterium]